MVRPNFNQKRDAEQLAAEIARGLEDATESLRWCQRHVNERRTTETMRLAQLNIAYIALALDWQMEGEIDKAFNAIDKIWWHPQHDEDERVNPSQTR
jgi:hypothetical protein